MVFAQKFKLQQAAAVSSKVDQTLKPVQSSINLDKLVYLKAIPDDYIINNYYTKFSYVLPTDFITSGDP